MRPYRLHQKSALAVSTLALIALGSGCSRHPAPTQARNEIPADLSFHRSLNLDEYLRPFAQEEIFMPISAEAVLKITPLLTNQPDGVNRTLAQIVVKIRAKRSEDPQAGGPCLRDAYLDVKPGHGFTLDRLIGADRLEAAGDAFRVNLGDLNPGESRIFLAHLEGSHEPGSVRLIGATLRGKRASDSLLFETLEGLSMDWQRQATPAKLDKGAAINSLVLADAEALKGVGRFAERHDPRRSDPHPCEPRARGPVDHPGQAPGRDLGLGSTENLRVVPWGQNAKRPRNRFRGPAGCFRIDGGG